MGLDRLLLPSPFSLCCFVFQSRGSWFRMAGVRPLLFLSCHWDREGVRTGGQDERGIPCAEAGNCPAVHVPEEKRVNPT